MALLRILVVLSLVSPVSDAVSVSSNIQVTHTSTEQNILPVEVISWLRKFWSRVNADSVTLGTSCTALGWFGYIVEVLALLGPACE